MESVHTLERCVGGWVGGSVTSDSHDVIHALSNTIVCDHQQTIPQSTNVSESDTIVCAVVSKHSRQFHYTNAQFLRTDFHQVVLPGQLLKGRSKVVAGLVLELTAKLGLFKACKCNPHPHTQARAPTDRQTPRGLAGVGWAGTTASQQQHARSNRWQPTPTTLTTADSLLPYRSVLSPDWMGEGEKRGQGRAEQGGYNSC